MYGKWLNWEEGGAYFLKRLTKTINLFVRIAAEKR